MSVVRERNGISKAAQWNGGNTTDLFEVMRPIVQSAFVSIGGDGALMLITPTGVFIVALGEWLANDGTAVYTLTESDRKGQK